MASTTMPMIVDAMLYTTAKREALEKAVEDPQAFGRLCLAALEHGEPMHYFERLIKARNQYSALYLDRDQRLSQQETDQEWTDALAEFKSKVVQLGEGEPWFKPDMVKYAYRRGLDPKCGQHKLSFRAFFPGTRIERARTPALLTAKGVADYFDTSIYKDSDQLLNVLWTCKGRIKLDDDQDGRRTYGYDPRVMEPLDNKDDVDYSHYLVSVVPPDALEIVLPKPKPSKLPAPRQRATATNSADSVPNLLRLLSDARADNYDSWVRVGLICVNAGEQGRDQYKDAWLEFSARSPKFNLNHAEAKWESLGRDVYEGQKIGIGTLHKWASHDSPAGYSHFIRSANIERVPCEFDEEFERWARARPGDQQVLNVYRGVTGGLEGFAYDGVYVYRIDDVSGRYIKYAECDENWQSDITNEVRKVVLPMWEDYSKRVWDDPPEEYISTTDKGKDTLHLRPWRIGLDRVSAELHKLTFMSRVAKCFRNAVLNTELTSEHGLDTRQHLFGFENGVLDLQHKDEQGRFVFRKARKDEFVSMTTGYDYHHMSSEDPLYQRVWEILADMWVKRHTVTGRKGQYGKLMTPDEDPEGHDTFKKAMMLICSNMHGGNTIQSLIMLIGESGSNGKSLLNNLISAAMGEYCAILPASYWAKTSKSGEGAAPFMLSVRGARYSLSQEVCTDDKTVMDTQIMKSFTGCDEHSGRFLFSNKIHRFYVDALPLWNVNHLPELWSERGEAVIRRPKGIPFPFKFSYEYMDKAYVKLAADGLEARKIKTDLCLPMFQVMLDFYDMYKSQDPFVKCPMSADMRHATKDVKAAIDIYSTFLHDTVCRADGDDAEKFFVPTKFLLLLYTEQDGSSSQVNERAFGKAIAPEMRCISGRKESDRMRFSTKDPQQRVWCKVMLKDRTDVDRLLEWLPPSESGHVADLKQAYAARQPGVADGRILWADDDDEVCEVTGT